MKKAISITATRATSEDRPPLYEGFQPRPGSRIGPAWDEVLEVLEDGQWHSWNHIVVDVSELYEVQVKTASNLLHEGVRHGVFERRGKYHKADHGYREVRWPKQQET